jgi:hypothetical protein
MDRGLAATLGVPACDPSTTDYKEAGRGSRPRQFVGVVPLCVGSTSHGRDDCGGL